MNLKFEDIEKRHERTLTFFRFLYYDWGDDDEDEEDDGKQKKTNKAAAQQQQNGAQKNQGTKEWQIYKDVNQYETKDKFGKQALKRDFYNKHIDQKFNEIVNSGLDEDGMKVFNRYCHYYNSLGIIGYEANFDLPGQMVFERRLLYLLYFITYPLNVPYSWALVFCASLISIMLQNPRQKSQNIIMNIFEEESMNMGLIIFLAPSGPIMRILINVCLMMWALQHVNIMAYSRLQTDPDTVGLSILTPLINYIYYHKVELNFIKNGFEIMLGFLSVPFVFLNQAALIFPILFYQYMKVKNMSNSFQKQQWKVIWQFLTNYLPPVVGILKLCGFGKEPAEDPSKNGKNKKTDEQLLMDQINEQQKKGQEKKKTAVPEDDDDNIEVIDTDNMKKIN